MVATYLYLEKALQKEKQDPCQTLNYCSECVPFDGGSPAKIRSKTSLITLITWHKQNESRKGRSLDYPLSKTCILS